MYSTIPEVDRQELIRAAVAVPSLRDTQPWRLRFRGWVLEVYRGAPVEDPARRLAIIALGAAVLNLRIAAAALGYGSQVRHILDRGRPELVAEVELAGSPARQLAALAPAIPRRRTNREPYTDRRVPEGIRRELERSARAESAELQWLERPSRRCWLQMATNEAMAVGHAARPMADFEREPQLAVLVTRYDGASDWLRAGQAMELVLLEATANGLATSLLDEVVEHAGLRWQINDHIGPWLFPQALIRFGYGPPASSRPIADVQLPEHRPDW